MGSCHAPQRSAWKLVERTAAHPRFADLYMLPSYEDGWHREFRCPRSAHLLLRSELSAACCSLRQQQGHAVAHEAPELAALKCSASI